MEGYLKFFEMSSSILNLFYLLAIFLMYLHEWFRVIFNQEPNV